MTQTNDMVRKFWITVYPSVLATSMMLGCAIFLRAIDRDAGVTLILIAGVILALGQLLNTSGKLSMFIRCGLLVALPILGMGTGMLTVLLIQGDTSKAISGEGAMGYAIVLAGSLMFGGIAGVIGVVVTFLKEKIRGKSGPLPLPLANDAIFSRQARVVAMAAPLVFALYAIIRGLIVQAISSLPRPTSSDAFSMLQLAERQNQLTPLLGIADVVFGIIVIAGSVWLFTRAVKTRRQILGICPELLRRYAEDFKLRVGLGTFLGLITAGLYWAFVFPQWSRRHAAAIIASLKQQGVAADVLAQIERRSRRTQNLGRALKFLGAIVMLATAFVWEEVLRRGAFPMPEEPFWVFCWLVLSTLALTWGSLVLELRKILDLQNTASPSASDSRPWLLGGGNSRIPFMVLLNIVLALGLLPLVIFPPIAASAVNSYVRTRGIARSAA